MMPRLRFRHAVDLLLPVIRILGCRRTRVARLLAERPILVVVEPDQG